MGTERRKEKGKKGYRIDKEGRRKKGKKEERKHRE